MSELEAKLREASLKYYAGTPIMSDNEYDTNIELLKTIDPNNAFLAEIGSDLSISDTSKWIKEKHEYPVGSLNKVQSIEEYNKWYQKFNGKDIIIEEKLDGISIVATYENGKLISALTRGNGAQGEVITRNFIKMKNVPKTISTEYKLVVRGEIILTLSDFKTLNSIDDELYKNPRNACAGIAKRLDGKYCDHLTFLAHGIMNSDDIGLTTELDCLSHLQFLDFAIVNYQIYKEVNVVYQKYIDSLRALLDYDIDGLVIKLNEINSDDNWEHPESQIAFKFPHQSGTSYIKDIMLSMNGGHITPVAIIDPINIGGITVNKISLSNFELCKSRNIGIGAKVEVTRRNDVIPYIESVLIPGDTAKLPTHCPVCGALVQLESEDSLYYVCTNDKCKSKLIRSILKWLIAHECKGVAANTIELLIDNNMITSIYDFINLPTNIQMCNKIASIDGFGDRKLEILLDQIKKTYNTNWSNFLTGLDIPYIGRSSIEKIIDKIPKLEKIEDFEKFIFSSEIYSVDSFANENVIRLRSGFNSVKGKIKELQNSPIIIDKFVNDKVDVSLRFLDGISFCFTGSLETMGRTEAEKLVKKYGGDLCGVSKKLTYLVTNDKNSGSSKNVKAHQLGIKIIDEVEFLKILEKK